MDRFFPLISSMFLVLIIVVEGSMNEGETEPQVYWFNMLPNTPMPSGIKRLLHHEMPMDEKKAATVNIDNGGVNVKTAKGTSVNVGNGGVGVSTGNPNSHSTTVGVGKGGVNVNTGNPNSHSTTVGVGKGGVNVNTGKGGGSSVNVGRGGVGVRTGDPNAKSKPVGVHANPFSYTYSAADTQSGDDPSAAAALFFLRRDLRPGKRFAFRLADSAVTSAAGFIPRPQSDAIPFSTAELPSVLNRFRIPAGSTEAAAMEATVRECEASPAMGETKTCATSLESMVDFAVEKLGTRAVAAYATEGGGAQRQVHKVESVTRVASPGGKGVVTCHPEAYAYAVFLCHASASSEVYKVEMMAEGGRKAAVKAVAVCHVDTARWNPKHLAFKVLGVKPGTQPVCHFLPQDHLLWAAKN